MPGDRGLRLRPAARLLVGLLAAAQLNCSVVLTKGPPHPGSDRYDPTGEYRDGVPCTTSRTWPLVDVGLLIWVLAITANYPPDQTDDQIDGLLTAAGAALSAWIGYRRTNACRELERGRPAAPDAAAAATGLAVLTAVGVGIVVRRQAALLRHDLHRALRLKYGATA